MISHDTQLCLTEPQGAREMEREEGNKEGGGRGRERVTKKDKGGHGAKTDIKLFLREASVHSSKQHPTQSLCLSIMERVLLPQAVDMHFADVGTIGSGTKVGN